MLLQKELEAFGTMVLDNPSRPLVAMVGGSKLSTKFPLIESLLSSCDKLLLGGAMVFPFLLAQVNPPTTILHFIISHHFNHNFSWFFSIFL